MFNFICVVLSMLYRKTENSLLVAKNKPSNVFKGIFDKNHFGVPVVSKFQACMCM